jgi:hypothetical protein
MRFFPKSERIFHTKVSCQYGFVIDINESDLFKCQWLTNFKFKSRFFGNIPDPQITFDFLLIISSVDKMKYLKMQS